MIQLKWKLLEACSATAIELSSLGTTLTEAYTSRLHQMTAESALCCQKCCSKGRRWNYAAMFLFLGHRFSDQASKTERIQGHYRFISASSRSWSS